MEPVSHAVLSYASPVKAASGDVPTSMELRFERKPVWRESALYGVALLLATLGTAVVLLIAVGMYLDDGRDDWVAANVFFVLALTVLGVIEWVTVRGLFRLHRFGHAPVLILLDGPNITVSDPVRFGPEPRVLALVGLRRCTTDLVSLPLSSLKRYRILLRPRGWRSRRTEVHVAVHEHGIVERAAADLQRAIDRANGKN